MENDIPAGSYLINGFEKGTASQGLRKNRSLLSILGGAAVRRCGNA
jgi:hypothetical protein